MGQRCWACGVLCAPPGPHQPFLCGWCGAVNVVAPPGAAPSEPDAGAPRLQLAAPRPGRRPLLPSLLGRALTAAVIVIVGSIFVVGVAVVQPAVLGEKQAFLLHQPLAALLVFNVLFNYAACLLRPAGPVPAHLQRAALEASKRVRRGGLEACGYCQPCGFYKPRGAHHCRNCGTCVMELDHHCWYINNCAGAANLRHFVLLLAWLLAGVSYGLALGLAMGWQDRRAVLAHTRRVFKGSAGMNQVLRLLGFSILWLLSAPRWLACWAYFTGVCWATLIGVGMLFARQVRLLLRGQSYLDTLLARRSHHHHLPALAQPAQLEQQPGQQQSDVQQQPGQQIGVQRDAAQQPGPARQPSQGAAGLPEAAILGPPELLSAEPDQPAEAAGGIDGKAGSLAAAAGSAAGPGQSAAMRNVRRVFGAGHPLTWPLPAWDVAPAGEDGGAASRAKLL